MKFSFSLERKQRSEPVTTGAALQASVVQPRDAAIIRELFTSPRKVRMYDAAVTNNLNADFPMTVGSANAEILTSLYMARGRARTLTKDNPTARGALRVFKNNVCGDDPFRLEMKVGKYSADGKVFELETETNRMIQEAWIEAGLPENCTARRDMSRMELYQLVEACALRDGKFIARHRRGFPYNPYGYALQIIDSDRLQESYMGKASNGNVIRFSIERDEFDGPVAYWILTRHPGDLFQYNGNLANTFRERVPADEVIDFNNLRDRAEQDIGFPEFDSVIQHLHRDRQFDVAHVTAAIRSACKAFFITQEFPTGMTLPGDPSSMFPVSVGEGRAGDGKGGGVDKTTILEPGAGELLSWGQKPVMLDPKFPIEAATSFKRDNMLSTATGLGLSYGAVSADFEKYSFSSARAAETPQRDYFKVRQAHMILNFARLHFNEWLKYAILSGQLDLPMDRLKEFQRAANFHGKRWPYVNPMQDAQTDIMLVEAKLKSPQEVLAESENGRNIEEVHSDLAAAKDSEEAHGIDEPEEVMLPSLPKGEPGQGQPPAKTGGKSVRKARIEKRTMELNRLNGHH